MYYKNKKQWCENIDNNIFFLLAVSGNFCFISAGNAKHTKIVFKMVSR